jgi:hypothetical protein
MNKTEELWNIPLAKRMLGVLVKHEEVISTIQQILQDTVKDQGIGFMESDEAFALSKTYEALATATSPMAKCLTELYVRDPVRHLSLGEALEGLVAHRTKENQKFEDWTNISQLQIYDGGGKKQ